MLARPEVAFIYLKVLHFRIFIKIFRPSGIPSPYFLSPFRFSLSSGYENEQEMLKACIKVGKVNVRDLKMRQEATTAAAAAERPPRKRRKKGETNLGAVKSEDEDEEEEVVAVATRGGLASEEEGTETIIIVKSEDGGEPVAREIEGL